MSRELVAADIALLRAGTCPNCLSTNTYEGPGGGVSANIICYVCGARYRHGPDGLSVISEPEVKKEETGISKERARDLEAAKLDRDAVFGRHKMAEMALERDEKAFATLTAELEAARAKIHDFESASWADAVQGGAAWRERALVGERALEGRKGTNVALRTCVHRLMDVLQPGAKGREEAFRAARDVLGSDILGAIEANVVRYSLRLLAGTPGACDAWFAAVRELAASK